MNRLLAFLFAASLTTPCVAASLIGDTITARWQVLPVSFDQTDTFVVGPGPEGGWYSVFEPTILDVGPDTVSVDYVFSPGQGSRTRWTFSSLDFDPPARITGVTVDNNWTGWSDDFLSFGDDFVRVDFLNRVSFSGSIDFWVLTIETTPIPEPGTTALVGIASATALIRNRRQVRR